MDIKQRLFMPDNESRLKKIEMQGLTTGELWNQFKHNIELEDSKSLMEQLRHLRHKPEPEQQKAKEYVLLLASHLGKWQIVSQLISSGVDPNCQQEGSGQRPLQLAALFGHPRTFQHLLSSPAKDVNAKDADGNTALMCAAQRGCDAIVADLLSLPELNAKAENTLGYSALDFALAFGHKRVLQALQRFYPAEWMKNQLSLRPGFYRACCFEACENGWVEILEYLADCGVPIKDIRRPESSANLADTACLYQQNEVLKFLCDRSVPLDEPDTEGSTPLFVVCQNGNLPVVKLLCEAGCDINRKDKQGRTPAYTAASRGRLDILEYLKGRGCDMTTVTEAGHSLLDAAIVSGCREVYCYAWEQTARKPSIHGENLPHRAAGLLAVGVLEEILKHSPDQLNRKDGDGNTPLLLACQRGCDLMLELLRNLGADFSCANRKQKTPALRLSSLGKPGLLRSVQDANGKLDAPDWKGVTALLRAARFNHMKNVEFLADAECNIHVRDCQGRTAAFFAAQNRNPSLLGFLAARGAPLDVETNEGQTPLLGAAQQNCLESVQILLQSPLCRVAHANHQGQGLAAFCALNGNVDMVRLVAKAGADLHSRDAGGNTPALNACLRDHLPLLKALDTLKCDLDEKNYSGEGGLHMAARNLSSDMLQYLLTKDCNINARDESGHTPFMTAAATGWDSQRQLQLLQMLHEAKCDIHIRSTNAGRNALHLACAGGHPECVRYLLLIKCDAEQTDKNGATPLMLACKSGSLETVDILLHNGSAAKKTLYFVDRRLRSCVHYAAKGGNESVLRKLVLEHLDLLPTDQADTDDETPLILAASGPRDCHQSVAFLIKECNTSVMSVDKKGRSAMHKAAAKGYLEVVKELRRAPYGHEVMDRPDHDGMTPLMYAAKNDRERVFAFLREDCGCNDNRKNSANESPMLLAAKGGSIAVVKMMLNNLDLVKSATEGGDSCLSLLLQHRDCPKLVKSVLESFESQHRTEVCSKALLAAARFGREGSLRCILKRPECNSGTVDSEGISGLHLAASGGHHKCVSLLLDMLDPTVAQALTSNGQSVLHLCCRAGSKLCTDLVLERPYICELIDRQDQNGDTALMCAVEAAIRERSFIATVEAVLNRGARQDMVNKHGFSAWHLAFLGHREDLIQLMERFGHPPVTPQALKDTAEVAVRNNKFILDVFQAAIISNKQAFLNMFWPLVSDIFRSDLINPCSNGAYLLHACAMANLTDEAKTLIRCGLDVNCRDAKNQTPFMVAVEHNRTELVKWLKNECRCDINAADSEGTTALMIAARKRNFQLVDWLQGSGARLDVADKQGRNALHWAAVDSSTRVFARLLESHDGIAAAVKEGVDGMTPVLAAAKGGKIRMLKVILMAEKFRHLLNSTPVQPSLLFLACAGGWCGLMQWLKECVDTPVLIKDEWNANLAAAACGGHLQAFREANYPEGPQTSAIIFQAAGCSGDLGLANHLVQQLSDIPSPNKGELISDLLSTASAHGHLHLVRYLLRHLRVPIDVMDRWGNLPCHVAALCDQVSVLKHLLRHQFKDFSQIPVSSLPLNKRGRTLLHLSWIGDSREALTLFLRNANDSLPSEATKNSDDNYDTPKFYLSLGSIPEILKVVFTLAKDGDYSPTKRRRRHSTKEERQRLSSRRSYSTGSLQIPETQLRKKWEKSIHVAIRDDERLVAECKSVTGTDVNKQLTAFNETLLVVATKRKHLDCVRILSKKSACVSIPDTSGRTAFTWACVRGYRKILDALRKMVPSSELKAEANRRDNSEMTPIMLAALNGYTNIIGPLHDMQADLNSTNINGCTALILAAQNGHHAAAKKLIRRGADATLCDARGNSALVWAARRGHLGVIKVLRSRNCLRKLDWTGRGERNMTATQWAKTNKQMECVEFIKSCIRELVNQPTGGSPIVLPEHQDLPGGTQQQPPISVEDNDSDVPEQAGSSGNTAYMLPRCEVPPGSLAIIIYNVNFPHPLSPLDGALVDAAREVMNAAIRELGFQNPQVHQNLPSQGFRQLATNCYSSLEYRRCSAFLLCMMSYGDSDHILASDGIKVQLESVFQQFRLRSELKDKAKIFITQACRLVPMVEGRNVDSLFIYSVVRGHERFLDHQQGGLFAQAFRDVVLQEWR